MTSFLDKLNLQPQERRWVFAIIVVVIIILNYVLVWPYFSEWGVVRGQIDTANETISTYKREIDKDIAPAGYKYQLSKLSKQGPSVALDASEIQLQKAIMAQTSPNFMPSSYQPGKTVTQTNGFFEEQSMRIAVDSEEKPLVDFLYKIGGDNSMVRVRSLSVKPADQNRYRLSANIDLTATYQKKAEPKPVPAAPAKPGLNKPGMITKPGAATNKATGIVPGMPKPTAQPPAKRTEKAK